MPKTKYLYSKEEKEADILETRKKILKGDICGAVSKARALRGLTQDEFAKCAGINRGTFSLRLKEPTDFRLEELFKIQSAFPEIRDDIAKSITT